MPDAEDAVLNRLIEWGEGQPLVRAMLLTSTRAIPDGQPDALSDYDVILVLRDMYPFHQSRAWLEAFGRVLALYRDPVENDQGSLHSGYVIQFEGGLKIDFTLWTPGILRRAVTALDLPPELDAGYQVLLDKDHLTDGLKPPSYQGYIPTPPGQAEFFETIEVFFVDATYVAKFLWRDDLVAAKYILDMMMKQEHLIPMLVWHAEIAHNWSVKLGPYGRRLKRWLRSDLWAELESTFVGPGVEENWQALFNTIALMRKAASEVGQQLGYAYPHDLESRAVAYLHQIKRLDPNAEKFA